MTSYFSLKIKDNISRYKFYGEPHYEVVTNFNKFKMKFFYPIMLTRFLDKTKNLSEGEKKKMYLKGHDLFDSVRFYDEYSVSKFKVIKKEKGVLIEEIYEDKKQLMLDGLFK